MNSQVVKMNAVQLTIRILVVILLANNAICQDGFNERDILRYSHMPTNDGQYGTINYNIMQRSPTSQALSSINVQYVDDIDSSDDFNRADKKRTRKVFRIKNPFQQQDNNDQHQDGNIDPPDNGTGASNQYATMQYSLPPDEFLQQIRAENQYYQQQHSTPSPSLGYTATPQPQYQYTTISPSYDNSIQQGSQLPQLEPKSHAQYLTSNFQYSPNTYNSDSAQSTPSPITQYLSTALPHNQVGTPSNTYVSSSSPVFISSPTNLHYVSSPVSAIQTGSPDYIGNRGTSTIGSNSLSYENNDQNKKIQIDHYDNSAHGIRFPINLQRQYQNEYNPSTQSPTTISYLDSRDPWNNNPGVSAMPKSIQDVSYTQYQGYGFNQQENRADSNIENVNTETHRVGDVPSANNLYYNLMQPDSQMINNVRTKTRDLEHETGQPNYYSQGEYGWKVTGNKKPQINNDVYSSGSYQRYQTQPESNAAISQMNFHMDTSKSYYDQVAKTNQDNIDAHEFAKAAARAHENMKQQQSLYNSFENNNYNNNNQAPSVNSYINNLDKQKNRFQETPVYYNAQTDLITASPYFFNSRENSVDNKPKQPFDHAKALKNIVPIDVSNVLSNSESQQKGVIDTRYIQNYEKDQTDQSRQNYRTLTDAYYKDKNSIYGFNIKSKPDDFIGADTINPYYNKQQSTQDSSYNQGNYGVARPNYMSQASGSMPDNIQSPATTQQQALQRQQTSLPTDIHSILKLNDVPYHLTQGLSPESLKFQNSNFDRSNIPTQFPLRLNQDVGTHQVDVTANLLNKLMLNKQSALDLQRPDLDSQGMLSTINGFKVANPFNVDLKLVAEMLRGKSGVEDSHIMSMRDHQYNKPPLKLDLSQLQLLFKNDNPNNVGPLNDVNVLGNPFLEIYSGSRYPYQGVKYSRSQEEEESIVPIADASSNHPIGAVIEQDDPNNEREDDASSDITGIGSISLNHEENRPKKPFTSGHRSINDRYRHPNALVGRHPFQRKYPKSEVDEPYPLLKPPPPHGIRGRGSHMKMERHGRRRRVNKPKVFRIMKAEPLFEAETEDESRDSVPVMLRPPAPVVEEKSDVVVDDKNL